MTALSPKLTLPVGIAKVTVIIEQYDGHQGVAPMPLIDIHDLKWVVASALRLHSLFSFRLPNLRTKPNKRTCLFEAWSGGRALQPIIAKVEEI